MNSRPADHTTAQFDTDQARDDIATFAAAVAAELPRLLEEPSGDWHFGAYSRDQFAALFLYQHAQSISTAELAWQVETSPELRAQINLDQAPTQQALSHAWRQRFTSQDRRVITAAATQMRRLYTRHQQRTD